MAHRKGMGRGRGSGWKNLRYDDSRRHSLSSKGIKSAQKIPRMPEIKKEKGRVINRGMGSFLNPPTHPEHTYSVEYNLRRREWNRGSMSLEASQKEDWLDDNTKAQAKRILDNYEKSKPKLESPEVQDWIEHVMGYFRNCYQGENGSWNASDLNCDVNIDALKKQDHHAGVHLIRKYYPEFKLEKKHLDNAYWGTKPKPKGAL